ncbi:hypothetical protein D3C72_1269600 [compost metagenome]
MGDRFGQEHLLGQEAVEQGHPGHGRRGDDGERRRHRHRLSEAAQLAHVAGAGFVVDDPGGHEQRGLEGGVVHRVEDGRHRRQRTAQAQKQGDQSQMADGGIGQQALEIILEDRAPCAEQQGRHARRTDDDVPGVGARQHGPQTDQQKDARLHHGRRMQIGADRGRGRHRARQPEMKGKLRALGQGARQDQDQGGQIPGAVLDDVA